MDQTKRIKEFAFNLGVDLVGISPVSRMDNAPPGHRPTDLMAEAKSVIVMAVRAPKGPTHERNRTSYTVMKDTCFRTLDEAACKISIFIEDIKGAKALPIPADDPYCYWDAKEQRGMGDLSHRHAAEAAGLGRLGKNSLLITPQFGNLVYLTSILTNLELQPDPVITEELCIPGCRKCLDACPMGALPGNKTVIQKLCRQNCTTQLPRGFEVDNCWECRRACPVGK